MHSERSALRFVLIAGAVFAILVGAFEACRGSAFERFLVEDLILAPTVRIIDLVWPADHVVLVGRTFISGTTRMNVTRGCEGVEMFLMLSAAILAWPGRLRTRLAGLLIGFVLAFCLSVARLMVLVYTLRHAPRAWESLHGLILPLAPVLIMAWYFYRWSAPRAALDAAARTSHAF
jgi:exosortase/archaeosortase family protein